MPSIPTFLLSPIIALSLVLFANPAPAQLIPDLPAAAVPGTCKPLSFNLSGIEVPERFDELVQVDERGQPVSLRSLATTTNASLEAEVLAVARSCKYLPASVGGVQSAGLARFILVPQQQPGQRPGALPAIADLNECAPKSEDYPMGSRQRNETGTTKITFTTDRKGKLTAFGVTESSGYIALDFTALVKLAGCKFKPGRSVDGSPIGGSFQVHYVWKLQ